MVDGTGVYVIDPEFAMYGPMGFDVGKMMANLLLSLFASHGHERCSSSPEQAQAFVSQRGGRGWRGVQGWTARGARGLFTLPLCHLSRLFWLPLHAALHPS